MHNWACMCAKEKSRDECEQLYTKIKPGFSIKQMLRLPLKKKKKIKLSANRNVQEKEFGAEILALVIPYT